MSYQEIYRGLNKKASDEQVRKLASVIGMRKKADFDQELFSQIMNARSASPSSQPKSARKSTPKPRGRTAIPKPVINEKASPIGSLLESGGTAPYPWEKPAPLMDPIYPKSQTQAIKTRLSQLFGSRGNSGAGPKPVTPSTPVTPKTGIPTPKISPRFDFRTRRAAKLFGKQPGLLKAMKRHPVLATAGGLLTLGGIGAGGYALGSAGKSDLYSSLQRANATNDKLTARNKELQNRSLWQVILDKFENFLKWLNGNSTENKQTTTQGTK